MDKLSPSSISAAVRKCRDYKLTDGEGLYLLVTPTGRKFWRFNFSYGGKQKTLSLGEWPYIGLEGARHMRHLAKTDLASGRDPAAEKQTSAERVKNARAITFREIAEEWLAKGEAEGLSAATLRKHRWLIGKADGQLGTRPIASIMARDVLPVLRAVEQAGRFVTARKLRSTMSGIFTYAVLAGHAERDPTADLRRILVTSKTKHLPAVTTDKGASELIRAIDGYDGSRTIALALLMSTHLFVRPGELRCAKWSEISFPRSVWVIPEERMKMRLAHRVPLSVQVVNLFAELHEINGDSEYCFPSVRSLARPISDNTINAALRVLGYGPDRMTAHGFRAMAATLINETGRYNPDAIDRQLSHVERNAVRRAYSRGEFWEERVEMMQSWSDMIDDLRLAQPMKRATRGLARY